MRAVCCDGNIGFLLLLERIFGWPGQRKGSLDYAYWLSFFVVMGRLLIWGGTDVVVERGRLA